MTQSPPRRAAVTGAASGIGRALATLLANQGTSLSLGDVDRNTLEQVGSELEADLVVPLDVADPDAMSRFAALTGPVDLLCLNAGVLGESMGPPWQATQAEWDEVLGVNLHGILNGLRSFLPLLVERAAPSAILITSSLAGALTWPTGGAYAASKHAALAVAEQAALHLSGTQVSVTVLCPALVRSAMSDEGRDPLEVAAEALTAAAEGRFAVIDEEWRDALCSRAESLAHGSPPTLPVPRMAAGSGPTTDTPASD